MSGAARCGWVSISAASCHATDRQVIECRDRIGFGPQSHSPQLEACISVLEVTRPIEPGLGMVADRKDSHRVPLTERGRLHAGARELTPAPVVVIEPEVVLERIGADDVVLAVAESKHDATRCVFAP